MVNGLLSGLRALDLTDQKGFICGKILGAMGIEVIKVEKPGGDPSRHIPPYIDNIPNPEKSLYWMAFNTDKKSITLNLEDKKGQAIFKKLVKKADFVIESFTPGYLDSLGIGYKALSRLNPRIIMTSITPFGQTGPYAHYKGSELIASAMGGVQEVTGYPDRPPLKEAANSIYFTSNAAAALGTVTSYYYREISGEGQHVDVSLQEVAASRVTRRLAIWELDRKMEKRNQMLIDGSPNARGFRPCKDGYVVRGINAGSTNKPGIKFTQANKALSEWMNEEGIDNPMRDISNWEEFDIRALSPEQKNSFEDAMDEFFKRHTRKEINDEGLERGINTLTVNNVADLLENKHLSVRDYWAEINHPSLNVTLRYPKHFSLCSETENNVKHETHAIGEDNDDIYGRELGLSAGEIADLKKTGVI
jgi:benzylsuccinate CoA-transferase BbsE subunit